MKTRTEIVLLWTIIACLFIGVAIIASWPRDAEPATLYWSAAEILVDTCTAL